MAQALGSFCSLQACHKRALDVSLAALQSDWLAGGAPFPHHCELSSPWPGRLARCSGRPSHVQAAAKDEALLGSALSDDGRGKRKKRSRSLSRIAGRQGTSNTLTAREARAREEARNRKAWKQSVELEKKQQMAELQAAAAAAAAKGWVQMGKRGLLERTRDGHKLSEDIKFLKDLVGPMEAGLPFKLGNEEDASESGEVSEEVVMNAAKAAVAALEEAEVVCEESTAPAKETVAEDGSNWMVEDLIRQLEKIRAHALELERRNAASFEDTHEMYRDSARNLLHYLALRTSDIRDLQGSLTALGLSSLGRPEAHTMASIEAVLKALHGMRRGQGKAGKSGVATLKPGLQAAVKSTSDSGTAGNLLAAQKEQLFNFEQGQQQLQRNTEVLLGPQPKARKTRIMVTMPASAANDVELVKGLLAVGMDCARVNCAHDDASVWGKIVANVRKCSKELDRECRIFMDLAGPKLRTGALQAGPRVARFSPARDVRGRVTRPVKVWLAPPGVHPPSSVEHDIVLPVEPVGWTRKLKAGDVVRLHDSRDKVRELKVTDGTCGSSEDDIGGRVAECWETTYVEAGTELTHSQPGDDTSAAESHTLKGKIVGLAAVENPIMLMKGDRLVLTSDPSAGVPAALDKEGNVASPARIACTLPEVFTDVKKGQLIKLDDGKIEGMVEEVSADELHVEIRRAKSSGSKLRGDKAINLPETNLHVKGLTPKDIADLDFVAANADIVGFSFVNEPEDVASLQEELAKRNASHVGICLKIETKRGFQKLPWLLLQSMRTGNPIGVMIARGDLAVECGWERLAEIQEEILWLCEAAHVPTIWATQVLEGLAKMGLPSRAEITDAAMGERAECVMMNKGPHIVLAVTTLHDILRRMHSHQMKKRSMLRRLKISLPFDQPAADIN